MFFMYAVLGTSIVLFLGLFLAFFKQKEIKINVVSREQAEDKEFFALRIESDEFLFLKDKKDVKFIQSLGLDDVDDYKMMILSKERKEDKDRLFMPENEKKIS